MHGFKSVFKVIEADVNARRSDYSILEVHNVAIGRAFPGSMDFIDQNISITVGPINVSKTGSDSADGPVGRGHYYPQLEDFIITTYCVDPLTPVRTDTFSGGFLFIARTTDAYNRRQVFFRSKFKSASIIDNVINSLWLKELTKFAPDGIIDVDLTSSLDVHYYINRYSFIYNMVGNVTIYYSNLDENGKLVGFNSDFSNDLVGSGGTNFDDVASDNRFNIPPGCNS
jgi:hypothetical protein